MPKAKTEARPRARVKELERQLLASQLENAYLKNLGSLVEARESSQGTKTKPKR